MSGVFRDLLKQTMGLDAVAIGPSAIERAVQERVKVCLLPDVQAYEEYLLATESEVQQLIEAAVVSETWFFRDPVAFSEMVGTINAKLLGADPSRLLRLLSLPCSTGEEPYSMAMAMLDAGIPPTQFRIDAVDISARALARAHSATYGRNSFRGNDLQFRQRYFEETATGHRLSDSVRECVHFQQGNMLAPDFLPHVGVYDVIFCRNLLVYFDQATQTRAIDVLERLLTAAGVAFVGPAEAGLMFGRNFVWSRVPFAFAFRKNAAAVDRVPHSIQPVLEVENRSAAPAPIAIRPVPVKVVPAAPVVVLPRSAPAPTVRIEEAAGLADLGRFVEAAEMCREHVRAHGPSAPALHLMGLISNAAGNLGEAVHHFRRALYLDQGHAESLVHLALLLEKRGDAPGALILRDRLRRLERTDMKLSL